MVNWERCRDYEDIIYEKADGIARVTINRPQVRNAFRPKTVNEMIDAFAELKASGVTILLVEQNIHFAQRLGDTVAVMDNGRVVHAGTMAEFSADAQLQQSLLGLAL